MTFKQITIGLFLIGMAIMLSSCSEPNQDAPLEGSYHEKSWVIDHGDFATADLFACTSCHGTDYNGGGTIPGCLTCHYDGPPFTIHPSTWVDAYDDHPTFVTANGFASCSLAACHGTQPFISGGLSAPSCSTANYTDRDGNPLNCHQGHVINGAVWLLPAYHAASAIADPVPCMVCHDMTGPSVKLGTPCRDCHIASDPQMVIGTCSSCHNNPPSGGTFPNQDGEHDKHVNEEGYECLTCHQGFGSNTLGHWYPDPTEPADVQLANGLTISFNVSNTTCTGLCHDKDHGLESW